MNKSRVDGNVTSKYRNIHPQKIKPRTVNGYTLLTCYKYNVTDPVTVK